MPAKLFQRDASGMILDYRGMNTVAPADRLPQGKVFYGENVRRYLTGGTIARSRETDPLITMDSSGTVHSLRRMNDTTPAGPPSGFVIISGQGTTVWADNNCAAAGLSGEKISIIPFRPNQSVQPWAYIADDTLMLKIRSDGLTFKMGIKEPQVPASVAFTGGGGTVILGVNAVQYRYVYRSSFTGALSNPSPESTPGANLVGNSTGTISGANLVTDVSTQRNPPWNDNVGPPQTIRTAGSPSNPPVGDLPVLYAHNFGLAVPATGNIVGISVSVDLGSQSNTTSYVDHLQIYYGGSPIGTAKFGGQVIPQGVSPNDTVFPYGGQADLWGITGLTSAMANDPTFGFGLQLFYAQNGSGQRLFVYGFTITVYYSSQGATITPTPSADPQVDKIDYYRFGNGLENYTYVGTSPNGGSFTDTLEDLVVQANPILQFDNFEPFPSIDLPRAGTVDATSGTVTWDNGDVFNVRWLPGTIIVIAGVAYVFDRRPTSTTSVFVATVPDGTGLTYEIAEPKLAQQPMRSMWGPTDNVAYMFACGDTLRPGTLYFTKGNNPDSAPDTNQIEVTSPSEPLQNGCIVSGLSMVFSTERAWLALPNFFNALATVTGVEGSPFTMQLSISNRGLFARAGICTDGGANVFFVAKDGIYVSPGGNGSKSITDADLFNLFPHEDSDGGIVAGQDFTFGITGITLHAPDFNDPDAMQLSFSNGYLYFDYRDISGISRTLVYDVYAGGWVVDEYQFRVNVHATEEGRVEGVLVACDSSIRELSKTATETGTCKLLLPANNAGDVRALKRWGDGFLEASIETGKSVTLQLYQSLYEAAIAGAAPTAITALNQNRHPYVVDFAAGEGLLAVDLDTSLSWDLSKVTTLFTWQPNMVPQPETTQNRPTDFDDAGTPAAKFVQGALLTANTFGGPKAIRVQRGDDLVLFTPNESPIVFDGQSSKPITFTPPFVAHNMRIITVDSAPWELWHTDWAFQPYPEGTVEWQSEFISHGLKGWQHIFMLNIPHVSSADITLTLVFDQGPIATMVLTVPNSGGAFIKTKVVASFNKFKLVSYRASSEAPFRLFLPDLEVHVKEWGSAGPYRIERPFGGPSSPGAVV